MYVGTYKYMPIHIEIYTYVNIYTHIRTNYNFYILFRPVKNPDKDVLCLEVW